MKRQKIEVYSYRGKSGRLWLKCLLALITAGVLLFSVCFTAVVAGSRSQLEEEGDTVIVLGCMVYEWGPSILLQDRLNTALDYWQQNPDALFIVSGGQGVDEPHSEARAMFDYLTARGIPEEQIFMEDQSTNTYENMRFSHQLMEEKGLDPEEEIVVISNGFHLTRSRMLFERVFGSDENLNTLAAPTSHLPSRIQMHLREPLALIKSFLFDR